jgi:enolase 1/2/3
MTTRIVDLMARRIWDSRGRPTVEVDVCLQGGICGRGVSPAGASRGTREAVELRDGGDALAGLDVQRALAAVRGPITDALIGLDVTNPAGIDRALIELDGTSDKSRLGGNATIATSLAVWHAAARAAGSALWQYLAGGEPVSLPLPEVQIFGGGAHAGRATEIQDFLIMPIGASSFAEAMTMAAEVYRAAGDLMAEAGRRCGVADEGGWWPAFDSNESALDALARSIDRAGYGHGDVVISLDIAASQFYRDGRYHLALEDRALDSDDWLRCLLRWVERYPIRSLEDPVAESDVESMRACTCEIGDRVQIIGDDFLVTRADLILEAGRLGACNAVLLKPNQVGTLTETRQALEAARGLGWGTIVSARSGETEDVSIAHLAVGWNAGQLKVGSICRSERLAKWNEVLRIEEWLGANARYAGRAALPIDA